jgi:uncharacterized protein (TIGR04141 family)
MATAKTFSLYLAKATINDLEDLLTAGARELVQQGTAKKVSSGEFADGSLLVTFPGYRVIPKWVKHLQEIFDIRDRLVSQSPSAVLLFKYQNRIFAISFSFGHVYIDDTKTEADFGLKVAINAVSDDKLRSVERSNIGAAIREFTQAAGQRELRAFGIDKALDLIRKVSGYATDSDFADLVSGVASSSVFQKD